MVVHFNGAFHSDYTQGTAERVKRRLPGKRVVVVSILPQDTLGPVGAGRGYEAAGGFCDLYDEDGGWKSWRSKVRGQRSKVGQRTEGPFNFPLTLVIMAITNPSDLGRK
jgi:hypothetical protein